MKNYNFADVKRILKRKEAGKKITGAEQRALGDGKKAMERIAESIQSPEFQTQMRVVSKFMHAFKELENDIDVRQSPLSKVLKEIRENLDLSTSSIRQLAAPEIHFAVSSSKRASAKVAAHARHASTDAAKAQVRAWYDEKIWTSKRAAAQELLKRLKTDNTHKNTLAGGTPFNTVYKWILKF